MKAKQKQFKQSALLTSCIKLYHQIPNGNKKFSTCLKKVILDSDVAALYRVETKRVNEAVKNNQNKFPDGYIIELDDFEWKEVRSKFSTSPLGGGRTYKPKAFTERGLYMYRIEDTTRKENLNFMARQELRQTAKPIFR